MRPRSLVFFAGACLDTGRIEEALSAVREGLAEAEATKAPRFEAELNRLEGELRLASKVRRMGDGAGRCDRLF
jgi:hypothetical protein